MNQIDSVTKMRQSVMLHQMEMQGKALDILLSSRKQKNVEKDTFSTQESTNLYSNYTKKGTLNSNAGAVSKEEIWAYLKDYHGIIRNGLFEVNGVICHTSQIEKMEKEMLVALKAENNVLTLKSDVYYGIETNDGGEKNTWGMCVNTSGGFGCARSESLYAIKHGTRFFELGRWKSFFELLTRKKGEEDASAAGMYLYHSEEEVKAMLDKLGFEPGMCTLDIDGKKCSFYYSNNGRIYPKYHYDGIYNGLTQRNNLDILEVGDEYNYNGNVYKVDEEGHVQVPYGEDLFNCLIRPKGKYAKNP